MFTKTNNAEEISVHIRWMIRRDLPEVLEIEAESFEFPWFEEDFIRARKQRNCIMMVTEYESKIVGFMIYELHKNYIHIPNFAVSCQFRRLGVGSQMIAKLIAKLESSKKSKITLGIRETNLPAQLFFRENGFKAVSVLHNHYSDTSEDVYLFEFKHF